MPYKAHGSSPPKFASCFHASAPNPDTVALPGDTAWHRMKPKAVRLIEHWGGTNNSTCRLGHQTVGAHRPASQRVEMSSRSQAAQRLMDSHHSTLHALFLAAKESGYTAFELHLVTSPKGRVEFCISPREHSEMSAKFEVRGNTVRVAASEASVIPADDAHVRVDYGGTRSGEEPVRVSPGARSSPPRRPAAVTCRDPQKMDWTPWSL
jgi:hypothetical protein